MTFRVEHFVICCACFASGIILGGLAASQDRVDAYVKLSPTVVVSGFYNHTLKFRAAMTNDELLTIGTNMEIKVDFFWGNHPNVIQELDGNTKH